MATLERGTSAERVAKPPPPGARVTCAFREDRGRHCESALPQPLTIALGELTHPPLCDPLPTARPASLFLSITPQISRLKAAGTEKSRVHSNTHTHTHTHTPPPPPPMTGPHREERSVPRNAAAPEPSRSGSRRPSHRGCGEAGHPPSGPSVPPPQELP